MFIFWWLYLWENSFSFLLSSYSLTQTLVARLDERMLQKGIERRSLQLILSVLFVIFILNLSFINDVKFYRRRKKFNVRGCRKELKAQIINEHH